MKKTILMSLFIFIGCAVQAQISAKKCTPPSAAKPMPMPAPRPNPSALSPAQPSRKPQPPTRTGKPL